MRVYMSAVAKRVFLLVVKLIGRFPTLLVHLLRVVYKTVILRNTLCLIRFGSVANSFIHSFIRSFIHTFFCFLFYDRSIASLKAGSPQSAT